MTIILVRHGATALNIARVLQPTDTPLNDLGRAQAHAVARAVMEHRPAALLSSDMPRALQTADAIARVTELPIATSAALQERNFGDLRGRPYDGLGFDPLTMLAEPPGGESAAAFESRVARAFEDAVRKRGSMAGPLVVVTHGLVIRALLSGPLRLSGGLRAGLLIGNTSLTIVGERPPHAMHLLGCSRHLGEADSTARGLEGG